MRPLNQLRAARVIGWPSLASGSLLLAFPRTMAWLYGLPPSRQVARSIGLRDAGIGWRLLRGGDPRRWLRARAASDALDALLIVRTGYARRASRLLTAGRLAVAAGSCWVSLALARRLSRAV